ncbi:MAG TPA: hypothetical protein PK339_10515 [Flavitalea sp.]|nr:hypothetical protein [Flavitalea sp.]
MKRVNPNAFCPFPAILFPHRAAASKLTLTLALTTISFFSVGQWRDSELRKIDQYISEIDSLSFRSQTSFQLVKFLTHEDSYLEHWRYSEDGGRIVVFQISYAIDSIEFSEVYYVDKGRLVCSEEYETVNHSLFEDELRWGGIYYFVGLVPRRVVSLGKKGGIERRFESRENPVMEARERFQRRYNELLRHLPMLPH